MNGWLAVYIVGGVVWWIAGVYVVWRVGRGQHYEWEELAIDGMMVAFGAFLWPFGLFLVVTMYAGGWRPFAVRTSHTTVRIPAKTADSR
jgi:hypothetical protein